MRKFSVHTLSTVMTFHSNETPIYEDDRVVFVKLSGNEITFERCNVVCVDEKTVADNSEATTTE